MMKFDVATRLFRVRASIKSVPTHSNLETLTGVVLAGNHRGTTMWIRIRR